MVVKKELHAIILNNLYEYNDSYPLVLDSKKYIEEGFLLEDVMDTFQHILDNGFVSGSLGYNGTLEIDSFNLPK